MPKSVPVRPVRMNAAQNDATSDAILRSQARLSAKLAPERGAVDRGHDDLRRAPQMRREGGHEGLPGGTGAPLRVVADRRGHAPFLQVETAAKGPARARQDDHLARIVRSDVVEGIVKF